MDDEDFRESSQTINQVVKERPKKLIKMLRCEGSQAFADMVLEMAEQVIDQMPPDYIYKDVSAMLKKKLDESQGGTWHVIVGSHFGANVTNDADTLLNFKIDAMYFLLFRSGPPERLLVPPGNNE